MNCKPGQDTSDSRPSNCGPVKLMQLSFTVCVSLVVILHTPSVGGAQSPSIFRAGASAVDITPTKFPVIVNGGFLEAKADKANDPLHARSLVLDDGTNRVAITVVDSCMLPRELIDDAKRIAHAKLGLPVDRMLISATHTHSAPSAMGCLGAAADSEYVKELPAKIALGIELAAKNLAPAKIGWAVADDFEHTHNRRWIYRPDKMKSDPFGGKTVRANMHPGYENPDCIGPSGPVDPGLSVVAIQSLQGMPVAVLANYSMHYFGAAPVSADYCGRFSERIKRLIGAETIQPVFVGIMSQGTSGDQMWMDYGKPKKNLTLDEYAEGVAQVAFGAYQRVKYRDWVPLAMAESTLTLRRRTPDAERLAWARPVVANMAARKPQNQTEVYALEQIYLHDEPIRELKLQALRIGDLGIAAIPNEVFAITGLKIKTHSPLNPTFTMELANGSEGYIPPPAQHVLGGYTTWPARTAALEVEAEPKITEAILKLLEKAAGQPRRERLEPYGPYAKAVLASKPIAYWRLNEFNGETAFDSTRHKNHATYENGVAFYLDGPQSRAFSSDGTINRCVHLAGGRLRASINGLKDTYTVELWFWNGLSVTARQEAGSVAGCLISRGVDGAKWLGSETLSVGGSETWGRLTFQSNGSFSRFVAFGQSPIEVPLKAWNHVALVRDRQRIRVHWNGNIKPEIDASASVPYSLDGRDSQEIVIGARWHGWEAFEGKIDEVAIYDRALRPREIAHHFEAAAVITQPPPMAVGRR